MLTDNRDAAFEFLELTAELQPNRTVRLGRDSRPPVLVYTDASDEEGIARIGALIVVPGLPPSALVYDPPPSVRSEWVPQDTVRKQAELYAAPLLACSAAQLLCGRDVLPLLTPSHFVLMTSIHFSYRTLVYTHRCLKPWTCSLPSPCQV